MLKVDKLSLVKHRRGEMVPILREISLEIPDRRVTLLLGKSGSGKTSLLRCIAQLEQGYSGTISLKGRPMHALSSRERCQEIGFVPQSFALFPHMSVLDNCAHPRRIIFGESRRSACDAASRILASLGIEGLSQARPHELSGGQQQRAAIARMLVLDPSFLLFDEPTSALDPENADLFIQIVKQLQCEGKGVIISTHDMSCARQLLDRAFFLEEGAFMDSYDTTHQRELHAESRLQQFLQCTQVVRI